MKRWTKKAIREMQDQITTWVLVREMYTHADALREVIERDGARREIVLAGLRARIAMLTDRMKQSREAAVAWRKFGTDGSNEVADRMERSAADEEKAITYVRKLIERIDAEELPEEVATYMPERIAE